MDKSSLVNHTVKSLKTKTKKDDIPLKVLSGNLIFQYLIFSFCGCKQSSKSFVSGFLLIWNSHFLIL